MQEGFKIPNAETMRAQLYEGEKRKLEERLAEVDEQLANASNDEEFNLIDATKGELQKKLYKLQAQYELGR